VAGSVNCLVGAVKVFRPRDRGARLAQRCRRLGPGPAARPAGLEPVCLSGRPAGSYQRPGLSLRSRGSGTAGAVC